MRNFFRALERHGASYLLISGQASVLYGAATFSEDVDLWIPPSRPEIERFVRALRGLGVRVYKLTPPLGPSYFRHGHGFHFVIPARVAGEGPAYLDVMGRPPRVESFARAYRRARHLSTSWGKLPVVSVEDLVELKKTRRLSDYEVISNLVRSRLEERRPDRKRLSWALRNIFRVEDIVWAIDQWPDSVRLLPRARRRVARALAGWNPALGPLPSKVFEHARRILALEIAALQRQDVLYWKGILQELRALRRDGRLLPEGSVPRLARET